MKAFLKNSKSAEGSDVHRKAPEKKKRERGPVPWVEKYRPKTIDEVAQQDEVVSVLKKCLEGADFPHLLFYGPPGTGKTSTILAVARQLFGSDIYKDRILELNASDERGIQVIRDKVKRFSQFTASGTRPDGKPCPAFKLIILDEADALTSAAQSALRRTIEKETKTTRFCLLCNYVSRIIEPLASRCAKFRFKLIGDSILLNSLSEIAKNENVQVNDAILRLIIDTGCGDLRKCITFLQSYSRLHCSADSDAGDGDIESEILSITGVVPSSLLKKYLKYCKSGSYENVESFLSSQIVAQGYSISQFLDQLFDSVMKDMTINDLQKSPILEKLALVDNCLSDGASEYLQIMDLSCCIIKQLSSSHS